MSNDNLKINGITLQKELNNFHWKNIQKPQYKRYEFLFNKMVKNIVSSCNPYETVTCDDKF